MKKFLSTVMASLVPFALLGGVAAEPASANTASSVTTPFTCNSAFYQVSNGDFLKLNIASTNANKFESMPANANSAVNGIGWNEADNYIYGIGGSTSLVKFYADGSRDSYTLSGTAAKSTGGDFIGANLLLTSDTSGGFTLTNVSTKVTTAFTDTGAVWTAYDLTYLNGKIYGMDNAHDLFVGTLTGTPGAWTGVTVANPVALSAITGTGSSDTWGADYVDGSGNLYFYDNNTAAIWEIPNANVLNATYTPQLFYTNGTVLGTPNDGASCPTASNPFAPIEVTTTSGASVDGSGNATLAGTVTPGTFTNSSIASGGIKICWATSNALTGAALTDASHCSNTTPASLASSGTSTSVSLAVTGLSQSTTYYYQAQATNAGGNTAFGAVQTITGASSGYTVTWAPNGGTVNPTSSSNVTTVTAPTPTLAGNAFNGWNCSPTGSPANPVAAGTTFTPSAATTCTASWTPYSVGYSVGTGSGTAPTTPNSGVVTLPVQGAMVAPANTTFGGWTCTPGTPSGTIAAGATFTPSGNATCTAVWTPAGSTYTVTWAPNGGSVSPTTSTQASSGASVAAPTPTLAGNAFNGWDCVPAGTPANPVAAAASFVPSAATTCTASWTPYTVGYSAGNGSGTAPTTPNSGVVVLPGQGSMTAPSGYTFAGWSCTPGTPSGTIAAAASFTPTGNATCTAQWTAIQVAPPAPPTYLVSFVNQGTTVASTTNVAGTVITCPAAPTRAGYIFQGWSACPAGGSYTITGAATITAIWVEELAAQPNATGGENAHQPEPVTLVVNAALTGQQYVDPTVGIKLTLTPNEADKTQAPLTSDNQVVFKDGRLAHVTGSGLRPNSDVQVYISKSAIAGLNALPVAPAGIGHAKAITFTDPILLGTLKTDANGNFADWLPIPAGLEVGSHVLQVDGYAPDWSLHSANFPVLYAVPHTYSKSLTVYFTPDSAKFTAATTKAVAALIALLPKDGQSFTVDSKGFVFPIDNHTANMRISSARAKAIALALKNGIKALGQQATVDHVGLGRINVAKQTSRRVEATVSWTVFETKG